MEDVYSSLIKAYGNKKIFIDHGIAVPHEIKNERPIFEFVDPIASLPQSRDQTYFRKLLSALPYDDFAIAAPIPLPSNAPEGAKLHSVLWAMRAVSGIELRMLGHVGGNSHDLRKGWHFCNLLISISDDGGVFVHDAPQSAPTFLQLALPGLGIALIFFRFLELLMSKPRRESVSIPPSDVNAERKRWGKMQFPHVIRLSFPEVREIWGQKHQHHASPTPHDRRGHARILKSGRVIAVRPSKIKGGSVTAPRYAAG